LNASEAKFSQIAEHPQELRIFYSGFAVGFSSTVPACHKKCHRDRAQSESHTSMVWGQFVPLVPLALWHGGHDSPVEYRAIAPSGELSGDRLGPHLCLRNQSAR